MLIRRGSVCRARAHRDIRALEAEEGVRRLRRRCRRLVRYWGWIWVRLGAVAAVLGFFLCLFASFVSFFFFVILCCPSRSPADDFVYLYFIPMSVNYVLYVPCMKCALGRRAYTYAAVTLACLEGVRYKV